MAYMSKHKQHGHASGPTQRQLRVGELLRRTLSDILIQGRIHDPELNRLSITIGEVQPSPDMRVAKVFVMPLGGRHREEALKALRRNHAEMRRLLAREITLKYIPELRFAIDETFDLMEKARVMFDQEEVKRDTRKAAEPPENGPGDDEKP